MSQKCTLNKEQSLESTEVTVQEQKETVRGIVGQGNQKGQKVPSKPAYLIQIEKIFKKSLQSVSKGRSSVDSFGVESNGLWKKYIDQRNYRQNQTELLCMRMGFKGQALRMFQQFEMYQRLQNERRIARNSKFNTMDARDIIEICRTLLSCSLEELEASLAECFKPLTEEDYEADGEREKAKNSSQTYFSEDLSFLTSILRESQLVENLAYNLTESRIAHFIQKKIGRSPKRIILLKDSKLKSKGYGLIQFEDIDDLIAFVNLDSVSCHGRKLNFRNLDVVSVLRKAFQSNKHLFKNENSRGANFQKLLEMKRKLKMKKEGKPQNGSLQAAERISKVLASTALNQNDINSKVPISEKDEPIPEEPTKCEKSQCQKVFKEKDLQEISQTKSVDRCVIDFKQGSGSDESVIGLKSKSLPDQSVLQNIVDEVIGCTTCKKQVKRQKKLLSNLKSEGFSLQMGWNSRQRSIFRGHLKKGDDRDYDHSQNPEKGLKEAEKSIQQD